MLLESNISMRKRLLKTAPKNRYSLHFENGLCHLEASCMSDLRLANAGCELAKLSHTEALWQGEHNIPFSLRPLWLKAKARCEISPNFEIYLPGKDIPLSEEAYLFYFDGLCKRASSLGFTHLILGQSQQEINCSTYSSNLWASLSQTAAAHSLGLIAKIKDPVPAAKLAGLSHILLPLSEPEADLDSHLTQSERLAKLAEELAANSNLPCLFQIPDSTSIESFQALSEDGHTLICSESFFLDQLASKLLATRHFCTPNIIPVANVGRLGAGEGLWPLIENRAQESTITLLQSIKAQGFICQASTLADKGTLADLLVSSFARALTCKLPLQELCRQWWLANHPEALSPGTKRLFDLAAQLYETIAHMRKSPKPSCDLAIATLSAMQALGSYIPTPLAGYFKGFIRDQKRILHQLVQELSLPSIRLEDEGPGFWMHTNTPSQVPSSCDPVLATLIEQNR